MHSETAPRPGRSTLRFVRLSLLLLGTAAAAEAQVEAFPDSLLRERLSLFAPARLEADTLQLRPSERSALHKIVGAARLVDRAYARQAWSGGEDLLDALAADTTESGRLRYRYFRINGGPWSIADRMRAFVPGVPIRKPPQANFYPPGMRRSDWGPLFIRLPQARQAEAAGPHHVVRRDSAGDIRMIPYSEEYRDLLGPAAGLLRSAGKELPDSSAARALAALADALERNDYAESERAAVAASGPVSVTIGATGASLDEFFRYKRAFEAVVGVSADGYVRAIRELERALPVVERALAPTGAPRRPAGRVTVRVDDVVFAAGGARAGATASTLRLPSDTALAREAGRKVILLRNVHERKFELIQRPIAAALLEPDQAAEVSFEPFFRHLILHELAHRYDRAPSAPAPLPDAVATPVYYPWEAISEADADLAALAGLDSLPGKGSGAIAGRSLRLTQLSSLFRALRFWDTDPFTRGAAIQFNYHRSQGVFSYDPDRRVYRADDVKMRASVRKLLSEIAALRESADPGAALAFHERYAIQPPELLDLRERLSEIPFDIEPSFLFPD